MTRKLLLIGFPDFQENQVRKIYDIIEKAVQEYTGDPTWYAKLAPGGETTDITLDDLKEIVRQMESGEDTTHPRVTGTYFEDTLVSVTLTDKKGAGSSEEYHEEFIKMVDLPEDVRELVSTALLKALAGRKTVVI